MNLHRVDRDDDAGVTRTVVHFQVGVVFGADLTREGVVVVRRDPGVASHLEVAIRIREIEKEQARANLTTVRTMIHG